MSKIPLFDLGNVILRVDFGGFLRWVAGQSPYVKDPELVRRFHHSSLYYDFEFGNIQTEEFVRRMGKIYGVEFTDEEFRAHFNDIFPGFVPGMPELLAELAERGPVYCLSNTNPIHYEHFTVAFAKELTPFRKIFASHHLRARKPFPGIYREVAREIGAAPDEIVFFDDLEANVEGARKAGLEAHLFRDADQVRSLCLS